MEETRLLYTDSTECVCVGDVVEVCLDYGDVLGGYRVVSWRYPMLVLANVLDEHMAIHIEHINSIRLQDRPCRKQEPKEMVDHPDHYQSKTGLEAWDVIEAFTSDLDGIEAFDTGNVLKYMCRWKGKNGLEDLKKAKRYLEHLIDHVENSKKEND